MPQVGNHCKQISGNFRPQDQNILRLLLELQQTALHLLRFLEVM